MAEFIPFLLIVQALVAIFVYVDSKRQNMHNRFFWIIGVALFMPLFLPFYMIIRPKRVIFLCQNCSSENFYPSKNCWNCDIEFSKEHIVPIRIEWGLMDAMILLILSYFIFPIGISGIANLFGILDRNLSEWKSLYILNLVGTGSMLVLSLWFISNICKTSLVDFGLTKKHLYRNIAIGILVAIPLIILSSIAEEGVVNILINIMPSKAEEIYLLQSQEHSVSSKIFPSEPSDIAKLIPVLILIVIIAPISEEIMFRGIIYNALRRKRGKWTSIIFSTLIFTFAHGQLIHLVAVFLSGFLLAYVYEKTKSLVTPIILHIFVNLSFVIALYQFPNLYT